jgi:hypothetical protein
MPLHVVGEPPGDPPVEATGNLEDSGHAPNQLAIPGVGQRKELFGGDEADRMTHLPSLRSAAGDGQASNRLKQLLETQLERLGDAGRVPHQFGMLDGGEVIGRGPDLDRAVVGVRGPVERHPRVLIAPPLRETVCLERRGAQHLRHQQPSTHRVLVERPDLVKRDHEHVRLHQHVGSPPGDIARRPKTKPTGYRWVYRARATVRRTTTTSCHGRGAGVTNSSPYTVRTCCRRRAARAPCRRYSRSGRPCPYDALLG